MKKLAKQNEYDIEVRKLVNKATVVAKRST